MKLKTIVTKLDDKLPDNVKSIFYVSLSKSVAMKLLNKTFGFLFILTFLIVISGEMLLRIRSLNCKSSMKTIKNLTCIIRSTKKDVFVSYGFELLRKVPNGKLSFKVDRVTDSTENNVLNVENSPICEIIEGAKTSPFPLYQSFIDHMKKFKTNIFDVCSKAGKIELKNFTFKNFHMMSILPPGLYKSSYNFFDENDDKIWFVNQTVSHIRK